MDMNFIDIIVIAVILAILGGAVCYIRKAKKRGVTCVGCPNGGNCNGLTGDFSYGIEGFYFENGEILFPVREMNISGNIVSLWSNLAMVGNDARKCTRWIIPSLAFENVNFTGV